MEGNDIGSQFGSDSRHYQAGQGGAATIGGAQGQALDEYEKSLLQILYDFQGDNENEVNQFLSGISNQDSIKKVYEYLNSQKNNPKAKDLAKTTGKFLSSNTTQQNTLMHQGSTRPDSHAKRSQTGVPTGKRTSGVRVPKNMSTSGKSLSRLQLAADTQQTMEIDLYGAKITEARQILENLSPNIDINKFDIRKFLNTIANLTKHSVDPKEFFNDDNGVARNAGLGLRTILGGLSEAQLNSLYKVLGKVPKQQSDNFNRFMELFKREIQLSSHLRAPKKLLEDLNAQNDIKEFPMKSFDEMVGGLIQKGIGPDELFNSLNLASIIGFLTDEQKLYLVEHHKDPIFESTPEDQLRNEQNSYKQAKESSDPGLATYAKNYFTSKIRHAAHVTLNYQAVQATSPAAAGDFGDSFLSDSTPVREVDIGSPISRNNNIKNLINPNLNPISPDNPASKHLETFQTGRLFKGFAREDISEFDNIFRDLDWQLNKTLPDEIVFLFIMQEGYKENISFLNSETRSLLRKVDRTLLENFNKASKRFEQVISLFEKTPQGLAPAVDLKSTEAINQYESEINQEIEKYKEYLMTVIETAKSNAYRNINKEGNEKLIRLTYHIWCLLSKEENYVNVFGKNFEYMKFLSKEYQEARQNYFGYQAGPNTPKLHTEHLLTYEQALEKAFKQYSLIINPVKSSEDGEKLKKDYNLETAQKIVHNRIRRLFLKMFNDEIKHYQTEGKSLEDQDYDLQEQIQNITKKYDWDFLRERKLILSSLGRHLYGKKAPKELEKQLVEAKIIEPKKSTKTAIPDAELAPTVFDSQQSISGVRVADLLKKGKQEDQFLQSVSNLKVDHILTKTLSGKEKIQVKTPRNTHKTRRRDRNSTKKGIPLFVPIVGGLLGLIGGIIAFNSDDKPVRRPVNKTQKKVASVDPSNKGDGKVEFKSTPTGEIKVGESQDIGNKKPDKGDMLARAKQAFNDLVEPQHRHLFTPYKLLSTITPENKEIDWLYLKGRDGKKHVVRIFSANGRITERKSFGEADQIKNYKGQEIDKYKVKNIDIGVTLRDANGQSFKLVELMPITVSQGDKFNVNYSYDSLNHMGERVDPVLLKNHNRRVGKNVFALTKNNRWRFTTPNAQGGRDVGYSGIDYTVNKNNSRVVNNLSELSSINASSNFKVNSTPKNNELLRKPTKEDMIRLTREVFKYPKYVKEKIPENYDPYHMISATIPTGNSGVKETMSWLYLKGKNNKRDLLIRIFNHKGPKGERINLNYGFEPLEILDKYGNITYEYTVYNEKNKHGVSMPSFRGAEPYDLIIKTQYSMTYGDKYAVQNLYNTVINHKGRRISQEEIKNYNKKKTNPKIDEKSGMLIVNKHGIEQIMPMGYKTIIVKDSSSTLNSKDFPSVEELQK